MTEKTITLSQLKTALLLVCASLLAAATVYAWLACEIAGRMDGITYGSDALILSGLQLYPLLFLFSLAGGFGCGVLISITLRRHGFMNERSFQ